MSGVLLCAVVGVFSTLCWALSARCGLCPHHPLWQGEFHMAAAPPLVGAVGMQLAVALRAGARAADEWG